MSTVAPAALRKTALNDTHRRLGAKMVDFGGWDMPVEYSGLIAEHMAVRTGVGVFDVSHMGDIQLRGPNSLAAVQRISMNDASKLKDGSGALLGAALSQRHIRRRRHSPQVFRQRLPACHQRRHAREGCQLGAQEPGRHAGAHVSDYSDYYTQLAIQGPKAVDVMRKLTDSNLDGIKNYWFTWGKVCGLYNTLIARTGYTGEDGFEIYVPSDVPTSERVWNEVLEAGKEFGILPCGLGARNTLRLESAMALYGHEISDEINVFEAGLDRYAKLDKGDFIGRDALEAVRAAGGPKRKLVGLEMTERGIARDGYAVLSPDGKKIGTVASGSPAPFLKKNIALAHLPMGFTAPGTEIAVEIRNQPVKAVVVPTPFYKRQKKQA